MARKLPWNAAANAAPQASAAAGSSPSRSRKRTRDGDNSSAAPARPNNADVTGEASTSANPRITQTLHNRKGKGVGSRTPSTSPPPAPPAIEFMREGWDADDGYVMVEDEFQAVAQSFTVGLHHAEYKRLKREARERKAVSQAKGNVSRAGAGVTAGLTLTGKRKEIAERQRLGVAELTGGVEAAEESSTDERGAKEETKKKRKGAVVDVDVDDLWAGTKLAGLMASRSVEKTSLMGLGRLSTSTRAAHGYGPSTNVEKRKGTERVDRAKDVDAARVRKAVTEGVSKVKPTGSQTKADRGDDGRTVEQAAIRETKQSAPGVKMSTARANTRKFVDDLDDFDGDAWDRRQAEETSRLSRKEAESLETTRSRKARPAKNNSRLDEVPVFLI